MKLEEEEIREIKENIKKSLIDNFIDRPEVWNNALVEINEEINLFLDDILIISPKNMGLFFNYDEMCSSSIEEVNNINLDINLNDVSSTDISMEIVDLVMLKKKIEILEYYIFN